MLGIGAMISMMGGNKETAAAVKSTIGKTIQTVEIESDCLVFKFTDDIQLHLWDDAQSCCESRYMKTDDDLTDFKGAMLKDFELSDGPEESSDYGDVKDIQFLIVKTSKGNFTVANYNEHNGYYGGFSIKASLK